MTRIVGTYIHMNLHNYQATFSEVIIPISHCVTLRKTVHIYERNFERKLYFLHSVSNSYSEIICNSYLYLSPENAMVNALLKVERWRSLY